MKKKISVKKLLLWRLAKAKAEAPPPPPAARLLAVARPWWETSPERFQFAIQRLSKIQIAHPPGVSKSRQSRSGHPVPTLIVGTAEEVETSTRILYLSVSNGQAQVYFQFESAAGQDEQALEVTFISESVPKPMFFAFAAKSLDNDYRLSAELSDEVAQHWERLKVTDRMPFRLILRPLTRDA